MAERLKALVLKTSESVTVPRVRIPLLPFGVSFKGVRIFSLDDDWFWRGGRVGRRRSPAKRVYGLSRITGSNPVLSAIFLCG